MYIKGPNGLVFDLEPSIATGLVGDGGHGYEYVEAPKPAAAKRGRPAVKK